MGGRSGRALCAVLLVVAFEACRRSRSDEVLETLPTTPVVSIHRLTKRDACSGGFVERTKCSVQGPPATECTYGLVHTSEPPTLAADCATVSGGVTTFMLVEPGVTAPYEVRYAHVPDAGLRLATRLGQSTFARLHHIAADGIVYSHELWWAEDAGQLFTPLSSLLSPHFWSMRKEQRDQAWKLLIRDDSAPALALTSGHEDPDYDGYFATLSPQQRETLFEIEHAYFDVIVDSSLDGTLMHQIVLRNAEWIEAHPEHQPPWFEEVAKRAVAKDFGRHTFDPWLALTGDTDSAKRLCDSLTDYADERTLAVLALTGGQCAGVVDLLRKEELYGVWADDGAPCTVEEAKASARHQLQRILPASLRVDGGVQPRRGCGAFVAAFAAQRGVSPLVRRPFDRLSYQVREHGLPCGEVRQTVFELPAKTTRHVVVDEQRAPWPLTCRFVIDDGKRIIEVTGTGPPPEPEEDE